MYQRLLEHLTTAVLLLDGELRVRWMNPAAEALLAVSFSRVQGISLDTLLGGGESIDEVLAKARMPFTPIPSGKRVSRRSIVSRSRWTIR